MSGGFSIRGPSVADLHGTIYPPFLKLTKIFPFHQRPVISALNRAVWACLALCLHFSETLPRPVHRNWQCPR